MGAKTETKIKLGMVVEYRDSSQGHRSKAAFVTGTTETCSEGELALAGDDLHLYIMSPSGSTYSRQHVSRNDADEPPAGERSWRPVSAD